MVSTKLEWRALTNEVMVAEEYQAMVFGLPMQSWNSWFMLLSGRKGTIMGAVETGSSGAVDAIGLHLAEHS